MDFLFPAPVLPTTVPWEALCDIAGQSEQWTGVAARVHPNGDVESSPIWLGGGNCVGVTVA